MFKKLLSLMLLSSGFYSLPAQEADETPVIPPAINESSVADKVDLNLTAGSSYIYSKNFGGGFSTYLAPQLKYKFTPKLHLNVGVMFLNSNFTYNRYLNRMGETSVVVKRKPSTETLAYISGNYFVNNRLTVSGMLMKDLSTPQNYYNPSVRAMSFNLDYKLTDHISIGAGVHMIQGSSWLSPAYNYEAYPSPNYLPFLNY